MVITNNQSPQSEAISVANGYVQAAQDFITLYFRLKDLAGRATDNNVATILAQMSTVAIKNDGSLATTPDQSPNVANPINSTLYPGLSRPVSLNQLTQAKTILDAVVLYIEGQPVPTQIGARAIIHAVIGQ